MLASKRRKKEFELQHKLSKLSSQHYIGYLYAVQKAKGESHLDALKVFHNCFNFNRLLQKKGRIELLCFGEVHV